MGSLNRKCQKQISNMTNRWSLKQKQIFEPNGMLVQYKYAYASKYNLDEKHTIF